MPKNRAMSGTSQPSSQVRRSCARARALPGRSRRRGSGGVGVACVMTGILTPPQTRPDWAGGICGGAGAGPVDKARRTPTFRARKASVT